MPLYGHEMDETVNPYAVGLGWAVKLDKGDFVGRDALPKLKADPGRTRSAWPWPASGSPGRATRSCADGQQVGFVTSGTFAPTLGRSLAMALVRTDAVRPDAPLSVDIRGHVEPARVVPLPFYRRAATPA